MNKPSPTGTRWSPQREPLPVFDSKKPACGAGTCTWPLPLSWLNHRPPRPSSVWTDRVTEFTVNRELLCKDRDHIESGDRNHTAIGIRLQLPLAFPVDPLTDPCFACRLLVVKEVNKLSIPSLFGNQDADGDENWDADGDGNWHGNWHGNWRGQKRGDRQGAGIETGIGTGMGLPWELVWRTAIGTAMRTRCVVPLRIVSGVAAHRRRHPPNPGRQAIRKRKTARATREGGC